VDASRDKKMFGMKVDDVTEAQDEIKVTTTGAIFILGKRSKGEIQCYQRIGKERLAATMTLNASLKDLTIDWSDEESCFLMRPVTDLGIGIRINADSTLSIRSDGSVKKISYTGEWMPVYRAVEQGNFLFMDENGGVSAYPLKFGKYHTSTTKARFSKKGWQASLSFLGERLLTSVFPPRQFDWDKPFNDRIVHHFFSHPATKPWNPYPRDDELEEYSRWGNILALHWWQHGFLTGRGKGVQSRQDLIHNSPWSSFHPVPVNEDEMKRTVSKAHQLGMRVIVYMTSFYHPGEPDEFVNEVDSVVRRFQLDGIYIDGVSNDIVRAYTVMRGLRKMLGNKILFVHVPSPIIGKYDRDYVYCPFIETYADYILKAEHIFTFDWKHLRYTISGCNISNSIGYACNYDYDPKFTKWLIKQSPKANTRLLYWVGFDAYVEERQKIIGRKYYPLELSRKLMREEYFPLLDAMQKQHTRSHP